MFSLASWVELSHRVWTQLPSSFLSEVSVQLWALEPTPDEIKVSLCLAAQKHRTHQATQTNQSA